jgi:hypothetical protein
MDEGINQSGRDVQVPRPGSAIPLHERMIAGAPRRVGFSSLCAPNEYLLFDCV